LGELLLRGEQQFADAVEWIALAAPMPQGGLLGPVADWSTAVLASRMAWKWSTTTLAWPSGATSALA
jgi:hypothetical protein